MGRRRWAADWRARAGAVGLMPLGLDTGLDHLTTWAGKLLDRRIGPQIWANDNACVTVTRNVEVDGIDDAKVNANDEILEEEYDIVVSDANLEAETVENNELSVGTYFASNALERWEKGLKRMKLKQAVQLFKNLKHLGHVCPGIRHCKKIDERGSTIAEAIAKIQLRGQVI
ncbi:UNVERIFIED_CONTAM: hypothetical protein Sradi_0317000 [Sesamum radiatum]|uniref:Uncharacterized protein n=1 Tax=Sesamum radiatum TaxID=300843 RepID=A0AAW2W7C4_SESRA